jgi:type II secretory pathway pseudopilin PulG
VIAIIGVRSHNDAMGVVFSYVRDSHDDALNGRRAVSLLETIIVLFIIGLMMALLFPALQAARHRALAFQCQNNLGQLSLALSQSIGTTKRFPQPNQWTVDLLRWMEEVPLADAIPPVIPKGAVFGRPKLMQCPNQSEDLSTVPNVDMCHYVLVVDRPYRADLPDRGKWVIIDRPEIVPKDDHSPWYIGPEISFAQEQKMFAERQGPHQSGSYYDSSGQIHTDK